MNCLPDRPKNMRPDTALVVLYRDTGSVEPGSGQIFGSVSGSENQVLGISYAKDTFILN